MHGWLERVRPRTFVLTDGSGRSGKSRLPSTTRILDRTAVAAGSVYGRFTDRELYSALLDRDHNGVIHVVEELAEAFVHERIDFVVGDAAEGYNPAHDICRLVLDAAVELARRTRRHPIANFDFTLVGAADETPGPQAGAICLPLDEDAFARKWEAAHSYSELAAEVEAALLGSDIDGFRVECLRPVGVDNGGARRFEEPPFYERHGARQVAAGHYERVLRYRAHVLPLAEALRRFVHTQR